MKISNFKQSHIRFTEKEYRKIIADAQTYRKTIPELLKAVYFRKKLRQPAMAPEDARRVHIELIRIGNNVNQIAKQLNSGFRHGFNPSVDEVRDDMRAVRHFVLGYDGNRKN